MIWTEEENDMRTMDNLMDMKGKKCMNCQWSNADKGDTITTCGHHHENFSVNSFCGYWTSKSDPKVKAYRDKIKKEFKARFLSLKNYQLKRLTGKR